MSKPASRYAVQEVVDALILNGAWRATKYVSPCLVIRATRMLERGKVNHNNPDIGVRLSITRPNYLDRGFIKLARKANQSFPIRRIKLQFPPKRRAR